MKKQYKTVASGILFFAALSSAAILLAFRAWNHVEESEREMFRLQRQWKEAQDNKAIESASDWLANDEIGTAVSIGEEKKKLQYRYIADCLLSKEIQRYIFKQCENENLSFEFIMAVIWKESGFDPDCISDNGESVGLMQIQERWHKELMDKLGCTDLTDPKQNVRVGIKLLKRHFDTYQETAWALMAYNGGQSYADRMIKQGKISDYAKEILEKTAEYEKGNGL